MARQPDIQYISFYMDGSAAKKMEKQLLRRVSAPKPKYRKVKRRVVKVDPVAVLGLLVAAVMLISMLSAYVQLTKRKEENRIMSQYIQTLQQENAQLQKTYSEGYDLEEIREIAMAIGMVPAESVEHISIDVQLPQPQPEQELSFWEKATTFLAGLFA